MEELAFMMSITQYAVRVERTVPMGQYALGVERTLPRVQYAVRVERTSPREQFAVRVGRTLPRDSYSVRVERTPNITGKPMWDEPFHNAHHRVCSTGGAYPTWGSVPSSCGTYPK